MLAATLVMLVGIVVIAALSHRRGYRMGGVMVVPLLVIYTFREPLSPLIFVIGVASAWVTLWVVREYTLIHGRQVFLVSVVSGVLATVVAAFVIASTVPARLAFEDAEVIASIFPGITAYNFMRQDAADRPKDALAMSLGFAGLFVLAVALVVALGSRPPVAPPVLALPTSDLVTRLGIDPRGSVSSTLTPGWLSVSILLVDLVIYEWVRKRYDLRLAGIIVIPLLAVFSVRFEGTVILYALGATTTFVLLSVVHWLTLLYGRVLLATSLVLGLLYVLALGIWAPESAPGLALFFIGLFVGVSAYTLHRVAPKNRSATVRISAALFVLFYAILTVFVEIPPGGLYHTRDPRYLAIGLLAVGLGGVELYRLERSIPDRAAFARESVFANVDVDGVTFAESPLVSRPERDE